MKRTMKQARPLLPKKKELRQLSQREAQPQKQEGQEQQQVNVNTDAELPSLAQERSVFSTIDENFGFLTSLLGVGMDMVQAKYCLAGGLLVGGGRIQVGIVYVDTMIDTQLVSSQIVEPLLKWKADSAVGPTNILTAIQTQLVTIPKMTQSSNMSTLLDSLLTGSTLLFTEGQAVALIIGSGKAENRAITPPANEVTVSSAMDAFVEDLETNCSMLIRRLPSPDLCFEEFTLGRLSRTKVKLIWVKGVANEGIITEARGRIKAVDIDAVEGAGMLAELIQDSPLSLFQTIKQTQRPDLTARFLAEGRFAILCTASPYALTAPFTFWDNFKTMDDYSEKPVAASYLRISRIIAFFLGILIAPLYLSFVAYNHSIVPPTLAAAIAAG
ncbi:MAG TPA: spore germination protein, partial [Bacillota bacterium]|nr:spore germination protein [Bacillota bacterium]